MSTCASPYNSLSSQLLFAAEWIFFSDFCSCCAVFVSGLLFYFLDNRCFSSLNFPFKPPN